MKALESLLVEKGYVDPEALLGLPPVWYKSPPHRSRAVIDPRGVLAEFGLELPPDTAIGVWDSTAEIRVLPMRPRRTDGWNEERLAKLVTRDSMIGIDLPLAATAIFMSGPQDLGGQMGFAPIAPEHNEPVPVPHR